MPTGYLEKDGNQKANKVMTLIFLNSLKMLIKNSKAEMLNY